MNSFETCIFCRIIAGTAPAQHIAEYAACIVIADINPTAELHWLIIPKKHIVDLRSTTDTDYDSISSLLQAAHDVIATKGNNQPFRLVINNGKEVGQQVFHLHIHLLAGRIYTTSL